MIGDKAGGISWFCKWLVDCELVGAFLEVHRALKGVNLGGWRRENRKLVLHNLCDIMNKAPA